MVTLLESFGKLEGLVVGPWGNGSRDLHNLVRTLAECRVASRERARGQEASDWELGVVRVLSERQKKFWSQFWTLKKRYCPILFLCVSSFLGYNFFQTK